MDDGPADGGPSPDRLQRTLRLPSQEERGYTRYLFASASKADFWGNTQTYLPVADFAG